MNDDELRDYRREVKDYWDRCRDDCEYSRDQQMDDYINNFLKRELEHARGFPRRIPKQPEEARKILILLVGYSLEPLLQSICAWQPKKVVLVLNEYYGENTGGKSWGLFIEKLTNTLVIKKLLNSKPDFASSIVLEDDKPEFVFRQLRKTTLNILRDLTRDQIVIDITGGKKSMVAGAYLFGAYANIDVSYVDFEDKAYDPKYGKPYGDGCTIGILPNPYERFGLRDWQRVEELYKRHAFQAARESVATLIKEMRGLFEASEIRAAKLLRQVLRVYESWDRGDYRQALRVANKTPGFNHPDVIPTVIPVMGEGSPQWPNAKNTKDFKKQANKLANGQDDKLTDSLYKQERLILYVKDELARTRRFLQNADYRTAFIRAHGISEVLLKSRLINQLVLDHIKINLGCKSDLFSGLNDKEKKELTGAISSATVSGIVRFLKKRGSRLPFRWLNLELEYIDDKSLDKNKVDRFFSLNELRNKIIHFCLWVPKKDAEDCIEYAQVNFEDFKRNWMPANWNSITTATNDVISPISWDELINFCKIEFLPPSSRKQP